MMPVIKENESHLGIVFPGQGSQKLGMAHDFYLRFPVSQEVFDRASDAIDVDLAEICFTKNDLLTCTEYTQPAILTAEIAIFEALQFHYGLAAKYFAGHSLGEYAALSAAQVITLEDGVKIVRQRGALMQSAVDFGRGAMAAVIHDCFNLDDIGEYCSKGQVEIANINSNNQIVLSGEATCLLEVCKDLEVHFPKIRIVPLEVSTPFHSSLMSSIAQSFQKILEQFRTRISFKKCSQVLSNFTGKFHSPQTLIQNLVLQLSAPVLWKKNMENLRAVVGEVIEIGPQRVLGRFLLSEGMECKSITDLRSLGKYFGEISPYAP